MHAHGQKSLTEPQGKFLLRALVVWLVFITVESLLGTLRILFLEPRMGPEPAQWTGLVTGSAALLIVTYLLIEWIRVGRWAELLEIGLLWVVLTFSFEMAIGYMRGRSWQALLAGYDIVHGGLMAIALVLVLFAPLIAAWLRNSKAPAIQN
ncbi:MAG TPA: hypothetical protein VHW72_05395 [Candidatus Angelobacter sp.]|nr:hypothetical protein [Candidatus Angelobacter sp.]